MANERRIGRYFSAVFANLRLGGVKSITLNIDGNNVDVSDADAERWTRLLSGRKTPAFDITCNYVQDDAGQIATATALLAEDTSGTIGFGPLGDPTNADTWFGGLANLSNINISASDDDVTEFSFTADVNGELFRMAGTPTVITTATHTATLAANSILHLDRAGGVQVTLPAATGTGRTLMIIDKSGTANHDITPVGSDTLDGSAWTNAGLSTAFGRIALLDEASGKWRRIFSFGTTITI